MNPRITPGAAAALFTLCLCACSDAASDASASSAPDLGPTKADGGADGGGGQAVSGGAGGGAGEQVSPGGEGGAGGQALPGGSGGSGGFGGSGGQPSPGGTGGLTPDAPCDLPNGPDARTADYDVEMARFVGRLQAYADCRKPGFLVFPQNAPELARIPGYLNVVSGIGKEDLYYGAEADAEPTDPQQTADWERDLDLFVQAGRLVLTIDYPFTDEDVSEYDPETLERIDDAYSRAEAKGYVPYAGVRNLGEVSVNPGHEPAGHAAPVTRTQDVHNWVDLLQPPGDLDRADYVAYLADLRFDLMVIDAEYDAEILTEAELAAVHLGSGALVVSYLSIGEAETYRAYWEADWDADGDGRPDAGAPAWLGDSNPSWPDNYKVRYWMPGWQRVILQRVDDLIDAGFDGAYLDIIDAWECFDFGDCQE
jgi:cysteinyl-tRNA synthetase